MNLKKIELNGTDRNPDIDLKKFYLVADGHPARGTLSYHAGRFEKKYNSKTRELEFDLGSHFTDLKSLERVWEIVNPPTKTKKPPPKKPKRVPESACTCGPCPPDRDDMFWREDEEARCPYHSQSH